MYKNKVSAQEIGVIAGAVAFMLVAISFVIFPVHANASTYAYVDTAGDVRSVVAIDWKTAIATAPGIHIHSGVLILNSASDFGIVGDSVPAF